MTNEYIRPTFDQYFCDMVKVVASRGSCVRRRTGAIVVNHRNQILSTGYNGKPRGFNECLLSPCGGALSASGLDLDKCEAVHAEQNALLQCPDVEKIQTIYCTTKPCVHCMKLICNTSCERVVYIDDYPHDLVKQMADEAGIILEKFHV